MAYQPMILQYCECKCLASNHCLRLELHAGSSDMPPELAISTQWCVYLSFWKRIKPAFAYLFGGTSTGWDSTLLRHEDAERFIAILEAYRNEVRRTNTQAAAAD